MKTLRMSLIVVLLLVATAVFAENSPDQPMPGEEFQSFFARITRGGGFPGIYLTPPLPVQTAFLQTIRGGYWVGRRDKVIRVLKDHGVDLWGNWYKNENSFPAILNTPEKRALLEQSLTKRIQQDEKMCAPHCPEAAFILARPWKSLDTFSRQAFTRTMVLSYPNFGGKTLLEHLANQYHFPAAAVLQSTKILILANDDFVAAVRKVGYQGPVYFRGLTAPDPENPGGHLILLNDELLLKQSPFSSSLLQTLELSGILVHELSHVFQDLKGRELGYDVQVRSAEAALMIEGAAETLAENAMAAASLAEAAPSALGLFASEQAVEIVYREGNEASGHLFPYTVGLPFATALYNVTEPAKHEELTEKILSFLGSNSPLQEWLKQLP